MFSFIGFIKYSKLLTRYGPAAYYNFFLLELLTRYGPEMSNARSAKI
jgi:hypothetical protein